MQLSNRNEWVHDLRPKFRRLDDDFTDFSASGRGSGPAGRSLETW